MNWTGNSLCCSLAVLVTFGIGAAAQDGPERTGSPADDLPPYITQVTHFGEHADWSHDGKRILFLGKTFGDVYEVELETKNIRLVTHHYYHEGYVRALYLPNGDILLSGAKEFDAANPWPSRYSMAELWVLDRSLTKKPVPLGTKCTEGPAVSRTKPRIAWTVDHGDYPDKLPRFTSQIWVADVVYEKGIPRLDNKRLVLDSRDLPFQCNLEPQNFRPPDEKELIFSAYVYQWTEVMGLDLETGAVVNYSEAPGQYDEPEGIFPDGLHTLVECDKQNLKGDHFVDIWKLRLDGSHHLDRVTYFSDYPGYKSSNPVVSDDGRYMAFQIATTKDRAGVGRGIFVYDFEKAGTVQQP